MKTTIVKPVWLNGEGIKGVVDFIEKQQDSLDIWLVDNGSHTTNIALIINKFIGKDNLFIQHYEDNINELDHLARTKEFANNSLLGRYDVISIDIT